MGPDLRDDVHGALVVVRPETGEGAPRFAAMLAGMYRRWAGRHGYDVRLDETRTADGAGIREATLRVAAPAAFAALFDEQGTHRLVWIPPTVEDGRRRTSLAAVEVGPLPEGPVPPHLPSAWGDQARSYVLHPYRMVKDLRTGHTEDDPDAVFAGGIDGFLDAAIRAGRSPGPA
ncbi:PCRF domain-containing protein [Pseudonocardia sp. S2-4]|uniref:PCRF domain-containing protein n=1 Tax=Pseudonocardia humida TaxID=2800819 RepID=A0ABT1A4X0_9PSEU|nr:PCRF domain-containing protein [Pseudonocardia humida]MCO1658035.1 PCRF domain-containing protein [Pseudonocardia humida]